MPAQEWLRTADETGTDENPAMKRKSVLVTGGAGYIGSGLCALLLERGYRVVVFDQFFFGREPLNRIKNHPRLKIVRGDVRDTRKVAPLLEKGMGVVHLASLSNDPSCDLDQRWSVDVNHEATVRLARAAKRAGCSRFVFASSCSVYGYGGGVVLTEKSPSNPVSLYARLKAMSEAELLEMADGAFSPVILRQATIFGLSPRMRFDLAINQMTLHAITRGKIFVLGGGKQWRPFLHVRDAANAFRLALEAPREKAHCGVFNVGSNENNFQIAGLAKRVGREIGNVEIEVAPEDADRRDYNVDFSRVRDVLGFAPQVDISRGIREVADFIRSAPTRDYNTGEFFNIKRMKEYAERPAIRGGEPVRRTMLDFPGFRPATPSGANGGATARGAARFDFTRAGEGLDLLLRAIGVKKGDEVVVGAACDAWLSARLKKYGLKIGTAAMASGSFAISPESLKGKISRRTKAAFLSEFDGPRTLKAAGGAVTVVVTGVASALKADAVFWKSDVVPGVAASPAARITVREKKLAATLEKTAAQRNRDWLESPLAGPAVSAAFDRQSNGGGRRAEIFKRLQAAMDGNVPAKDCPPGRFAVMFKTSRDAGKFITAALAERMECRQSPEGWKPAGNGRLVFLPVSPSMSDADVADMARILQKLL